MLNILSNRKGLSAIVATVLLIALTLAITSIVWVVVSNLVKDKIESTESCGILNEVDLNTRYTCYNQTTGNDEFWFSIDVGEVEELEDILVSISGQGTSSSFKINENPLGLAYYNRSSPAAIPGKKQGRTYIYQLPSSFTQAPDSIEIAPVINGELCGISSIIQEFDSCSLLA